jgi:DNA-binding GntR family transcriptional regulator
MSSAAPTTQTDGRGGNVALAYERLRELIIGGAYFPGQRLTQNELSDAVGVGRTPLREALRMLEADGFLDSVANRGVTVSSVELGSTEELYAIRLLLEPPLISSLVSELTPGELAEMEASLDGMVRSATRRSDFQEEHLRFHQVAVRRYGPAIESLVLGLYRRIVWSQRVYMTQPRATDDFVDLDRQLLEAMRAQNGPLAKQLLEFHLIDAALGLVLAVEPDHEFAALPRAAHGIGIDLRFPPPGVFAPVGIAWQDGSPALVGIATGNAVCVGPA